MTMMMMLITMMIMITMMTLLMTMMTIIGTLRNCDGDGKETRQKSNRFNEQNNDSARASPFCNFSAVPAKL